MFANGVGCLSLAALAVSAPDFSPAIFGVLLGAGALFLGGGSADVLPIRPRARPRSR